MTEEDLTRHDKTLPATRYRTMFLTLAREIARKPNGRPAQLTMLAAYVRREHPTVLHAVSVGGRLLSGDATTRGADEFRREAATILEHLTAARIVGDDLPVRAGWQLPPPSRMAASIVPAVIDELGRDRYAGYLRSEPEG